MRTVYRLLGVVRRYGPEPVEAACSKALDLDVVSVTKIASMLARATEKTTTDLPPTGTTTGHFAWQSAEFATTTTTASTGTAPATEGTTTASAGTTTASGGTAQLTLIHGGAQGADDLSEQEPTP
ncbi:hypothetical protein NF556_05670 [Ornithinimicrobium faecis]|uniref:Uncharacterized protein n=1 Tax=Ornithinimicrobium faecis TaxID=2934158 RepID=A0ABY4YWH3_9MICO|nr:hypothetical protein [Ornithinimicrobium sp. HY1793]USQ81133.1 hypothetical protein NF556_05670 [Ornithinimicrobium sp. HY1793]